jgi:lipid-A-disaccharide synthase
MNLKTILNNIKFCKADIEKFQPDVIIFIDYPGFNMRIAKWAKQKGIKTHYYIAPQIWAWKENRIKAIKRDFDKLFVILPFEKDFFEKKHHFPVEFVGHPLIDAINNRKEISKMLSSMLSVVDDFQEYQFVIAGAPSQEFSFYEQFLTTKNVKFVANKTYDLLSNAKAALVTSGTATLETALFKVPEVVCYKGSWASYQIAKRVITLKYISLVNLIMDAPIVTELIQENCTTKQIKVELLKVLETKHREQLLANYDVLINKLGGIGASEKTAKFIVKELR